MLEPSKVNLVIYHADCSDGFGAAWAAWTVLGNRAEYHAARHGTQPPNVTGKIVLFLDFVYEKDVMFRLFEEAEDFLVIDHHKTAMVDMVDVPKAIIDMTKSGTILTWEYLYPGKEPPKFLRYIQDRDLWAWELPYSREFSASFDMVPFEFEEYDRFTVDSAFDDACKRGSYILAYARTLIDKTCKRAVRRRIGDWECLVVNSFHWRDEIGQRLAREADCSLIWYYDHEEQYYACSLRSAHDDVDVSTIAKRFGGGGHRRSSGMQLKIDNIEEIFDDEDSVED